MRERVSKGMDTSKHGSCGLSWRLAITRHIELKCQEVISSVSSQIYGSQTKERAQSRKRMFRRIINKRQKHNLQEYLH